MKKDQRSTSTGDFAIQLLLSHEKLGHDLTDHGDDHGWQEQTKRAMRKVFEENMEDRRRRLQVIGIVKISAKETVLVYNEFFFKYNRDRIYAVSPKKSEQICMTIVINSVSI